MARGQLFQTTFKSVICRHRRRHGDNGCRCGQPPASSRRFRTINRVPQNAQRFFEKFEIARVVEMTVAVKMGNCGRGYSSVQIEGLKGFTGERFLLEVGDNVESWMSNHSLKISAFKSGHSLSSSTSIGKFGSENVFKPRFDFIPNFISGFTDGRGKIGISLNIFKRQTVKMIAGQGLQPVPKGSSGMSRKTLRLTSYMMFFLDFR